MSKHRKKIASISAFLGTALLIYSCGGGGGGDGGGTPAAGTAGTQSSATATKSIIDALGKADFGMQIGTDPDSAFKPAVRKAGTASSDASKIRQAVAEFKGTLRTRQKISQAAVSKDFDCAPPGTGGEVFDNKNDADDRTNFYSLTASNCIITLFPGATLTLDGSFSMTSTETGFNITLTDFSTKVATSSGSEERLTNGTMIFTGSPVACGTSEVFLSDGSLTLNITGSKKVDDNGDGSLEENDSFAFSDFVMTIVEQFVPTGCIAGPLTITANGAATVTDNIDGDDNYSATYTNFQSILTPDTRTIQGENVSGVTVSLSGSVAITSPCTNGTFTVETPAGNLPFVPEDESCPVSGQILVRSSGATSAVNFTGTGGVEIDDGNDGSTDRTFDDCEKGEVCDS